MKARGTPGVKPEVTIPDYIYCPHCRDHQSHVTARRWYDYILNLPQILMRRIPRRCEHCFRRFWVKRGAIARGEEKDLRPSIEPNRW